MREEQIVLENVTEPSPVGREIDSALTVEERLAVDDDAPAQRTGDPGQRIDQARLARARAAEQADDRRVGLECNLEPEVAQHLRDVDIDHDRAPRTTAVFRRAIHSAATSATNERMTAITLRRSAWGSPLGVCVYV